MSQWDSCRGLPPWEAGWDASGWRQKASGRRARQRVAHTGNSGILRAPIPRSLQELAWATQEKRHGTLKNTCHKACPDHQPTQAKGVLKQQDLCHEPTPPSAPSYIFLSPVPNLQEAKWERQRQREELNRIPSVCTSRSHRLWGRRQASYWTQTCNWAALFNTRQGHFTMKVRLLLTGPAWKAMGYGQDVLECRENVLER